MIWRLPAARAAASVTASTRPWVLKFAAGLIRAPPCAGFKDSANTIKAGAVLSLDGKLFVVETSTHVEKGAQGKAFYNFELKDMRSGAKKNLRVPPSEKLELVSVVGVFRHPCLNCIGLLPRHPHTVMPSASTRRLVHLKVSLNKPAPMSLLYRDGSNLVLMDDETFEQLEVADSIVDSGSRRFLVDGMKLEVCVCNDVLCCECWPIQSFFRASS